METIDVTKIKNDAVFHAFVEAVATKDGICIPLANDGKYEVELKINGVEVPFSNIITRLYETYNENLENKAKDLIQDKVDAIDKVYQISDMLEKFKYEIAEKISKLINVNVDDVLR